MTKAGDAGRGVYMTDGVINVALLDFRGDPVPGISHDAADGANPDPFFGLYHFGMWVDDLEQAEDQVRAAGAEHVRGRRPDEPNRFYEVKYRSPDGLIFDLTTSGWLGAMRDPKTEDTDTPEAAPIHPGAVIAPDGVGDI